MTERLRVLLLFGGRSAEHDVSRSSAVTAAAALDPARYDVVPVAITKEGAGCSPTRRAPRSEGPRDSLPAAFAVQGAPVAELSDPTTRELVPLEPGVPGAPAPVGFDVVVPLLHGPYGEDGTVQGLFELAACPVRRLGRRRLRGRDGQGDDEARVRGRRDSPHLRTWRSRDGHDLRRVHAARRGRARLPVLREARQPGLVGRRLEGARPRPARRPRSSRAAAFDEWIIVEEEIAGP